jgi:hypothetical protein
VRSREAGEGKVAVGTGARYYPGGSSGNIRLSGLDGCRRDAQSLPSPLEAALIPLQNGTGCHLFVAPGALDFLGISRRSPSVRFPGDAVWRLWWLSR